MNGFINNIISRHANTTQNIKPRLPERFEPVSYNAGLSTGLLADTSATDPATLINETVGTNNPGSPGSIKNEVSPARENINAPAAFSEERILNRNSLPGNEKLDDIYRLDLLYNNITRLDAPTDTVKTNEDPAIAGITGIPGNAKTGMANAHSLSFNKTRREPFQKPSFIQPAFMKQGMPNRDLTLSPAIAGNPDFHNLPPVIKVSIGKIVVRAMSSVSPANMQKSNIQKPKMSLEAYLEKRNNR